MKKILNKVVKEIKSNPFVYLLLSLILVGGLFIRVLNINNLLGFYYDQGRDALVIWDLWHMGNVPFIGPTTGIAGIFRGPYYYYLIAPFYFLGGGDPAWPSVALSVTTMMGVFLAYYLGFKFQSRITGLIAAFVASFSFNIVLASRWLSNPTPMLLLSMIIVLLMYLIIEGKKNIFPWLVFFASVSLFHFGSSGELFYFLAILILAIVKRKEFFQKRNLLLCFLGFLAATLPLIAFDIKNKGLIVGNIKTFLIDDKSFSPPTWKFVGDKFRFYYDVFTNKIFDARFDREKFVLIGILFYFIYHLRDFIKNKGVRILLLLLGSATIGILFFRGNSGNFYDYYLTGYYLIFILLLAIVLGNMWKYKLGKLFVIFFIWVFLDTNAPLLKMRFTDGGLGENTISFIAQKKAIDYVFEDGKGEKFNVDVYVPPVIPYAYDYLFMWQGEVYEKTGKCEVVGCGMEKEKRLSTLYTVFEQDYDHQERLDAWLERQKGIGKVLKEERFGAVTVQKRLRYESN